MRPLHLSDLHVAACALRGLTHAEQLIKIQGAIAAAQTADRYRKRLDKAHPQCGPGTLSGAIGPVIEPPSCDAAYLAAMAVAVAALRDC